jgi:hypothetical protein
MTHIETAPIMWALLLRDETHADTVAQLLGADIRIEAMTRFRAGPQQGETAADVIPQDMTAAEVAFLVTMTDLAPETLRCTWEEGCPHAAVMVRVDGESPNDFANGRGVDTNSLVCAHHLGAAAAEIGAENLTAMYGPNARLPFADGDGRT